MSFSNNSSVSTLSTNASSERIYDFEYMMKLAASSVSAMSSTSTLAQLNSDEDVAEIVKLSPLTSIQNSRNSQNSHNSDSENEEYYYYGATDDNESEDSDSDEYEEYGSWYDIRTDLSEDLLDELRDAVYDAINLELPLSPVSEPVSLPLDLPAQAETKPALPARSLQTLVQQQQQKYSAPIVQTLAPPIQFQSRAFATLDARRQSKPVQRQTHTVTVNALKASNAFNPNAYNPSNAFNWRRDVPRNSRNSYSNLRETTQTRNTFLIRSNVNANINVSAKANTVSSWRNTKPGTEWKYNEEAKGYTLITV